MRILPSVIRLDKDIPFADYCVHSDVCRELLLQYYKAKGSVRSAEAVSHIILAGAQLTVARDKMPVSEFHASRREIPAVSMSLVGSRHQNNPARSSVPGAID